MNVGALAGLKVIDLTSFVSGPYCTMILADHGADVIKVERPGRGDDLRGSPPFVGGESAPFMQVNRNKRSIVLDLKDQADARVCGDLAARADVFVENFKPGTADSLGLGYAALSARNPRLIYCSISGFGQTGPYRERGGFDLMTQAMSGLMSVCGDEDGPPHRLPPPISDIGAGMFAAIGILAALAARERTGLGQFVDTSLYDTAVSFGIYEAAEFFATGKRPSKLGQAHRGSAPYQVFRTADGWLTIGGASEAFWTRLCQILGVESLLADPRFKSNAARVANRKTLVVILQARLETQPTTHWCNLLDQAGIPNGPVQTYDQVLTSELAEARGMVAKVGHPAAGETRVLGVPVKLSATPGAVRSAAPRLGEHTSAVMQELRAAKEQGS
ncbi:MAG TPA: CoA transferase [Candidatus Cybelea sp.]|nr:CoA transferase [Candidatus Cybelea sp.]